MADGPRKIYFYHISPKMRATWASVSKFYMNITVLRPLASRIKCRSCLDKQKYFWIYASSQNPSNPSLGNGATINL